MRHFLFDGDSEIEMPCVWWVFTAMSVLNPI